MVGSMSEPGFRSDKESGQPFGCLPTENVYGTWPKSGEIDIMENIGSEPSKIFGTIHYGHDFWRFTGEDYYLPEGTFNDDFHVFTVLWNEDCIKFLVDGIEYSGPYTRSSRPANHLAI